MSSIIRKEFLVVRELDDKKTFENRNKLFKLGLQVRVYNHKMEKLQNV